MSKLRNTSVLAFIFFGVTLCFSFRGVSQTQIINGVVDYSPDRFDHLEGQLDPNEPSESADYYYNGTIRVENYLDVETVEVISFNSVLLSPVRAKKIVDRGLETNFLPDVRISLARKQPFALVYFFPIIKDSDGSLRFITDYKLKITGKEKTIQTLRTQKSNVSSVLASGKWYKVRLKRDGIYKIDATLLSTLGADVSSINPSQVNIYGHPGGMLPIKNYEYIPGDPQKLAVWFSGNSDDILSNDEYFLFYAEGPDSWTYNTATDKWTHSKNQFDAYAYFFIRVDDDSTPKRIEQAEVIAEEPDGIINTYDDLAFYEVNDENLIESGRVFFGEKFDAKLEYSFPFSFPNLKENTLISIRTAAAARNFGGSTSSFTVTPSGGAGQSFSLPGVSGDYRYATYAESLYDYIPDAYTTNLSIKVKYNQQNPTNLGWLDFVAVNVISNLNYRNGQLLFRTTDQIEAGYLGEYQLSNAGNDVQIWEVTNYADPVLIPSNQSNSNLTFKRLHEFLQEYVAFKPSDAFSPEPVGAVVNQNIHFIQEVDMIILTHPDFLPAAQELAAFHQEEGLISYVTTPAKVYNEFSSGKADPSAIKHFMMFLYDNAASIDELPKYLLLIGDASYDQRPGSDKYYLLTYQSQDSWNKLKSYITDDYFGLLDESESDQTEDLVDIGIGRLPVTSLTEANGIVNKIKTYRAMNTIGASGNNPSYGNWRNLVTFIGDDGDSNKHMSDAESLSNKVKNNYPNFNLEKIYFDAFQRESTQGVLRYPEVEKRIRDGVQRGALLTNYVGHGGEVGWAEERVLNIPTIVNWTNLDKLTLMFTATCEFSRFDDHNRVSAGELCLLNANGGAIALLTTTRVVYSSQNFNLANKFYNYVFNEMDNPDYRLGDIIRLTKRASASPSQNNHRNFSLLGDPAIRLAYPRIEIGADSINNSVVLDDFTVVDTLNALAKVSFKGHVNLPQDELAGYNGRLFPIVYGKERTLQTLGNGGAPKFTYKNRNSVLFTGAASISDGGFNFEFIVPKDVPFQYGTGKLSLYHARDNSYEDGAGSSFSFSVGGLDTSSVTDDKGPEISLFMNNEEFVNGSITNQKPILVAKLFDENGLNTVGTGIGHDISAIIDGETENSIILNDFYEADMDTYKSGKLEYQLESLEEGRHTLQLKAWDVYNNSSTATIDFEVTQEAELEIDRVLNYPNPFTTYTEFWFEHNQAYSSLEVKLQIFTVSGRLVKTMHRTMQTDGYRSEPIPWDGKDDFGDRLARGVYVYKLSVKNETGNSLEKFEKLVILN